MSGIVDVDVRKIERDRRQLEVRLVSIEDQTSEMFGSKAGSELPDFGSGGWSHEIEGKLQPFFALRYAELLLHHLRNSERQVLFADRKKAQPCAQSTCLSIGY